MCLNSIGSRLLGCFEEMMGSGGNSWKFISFWWFKGKIASCIIITIKVGEFQKNCLLLRQFYVFKKFLKIKYTFQIFFISNSTSNTINSKLNDKGQPIRKVNFSLSAPRKVKYFKMCLQNNLNNLVILHLRLESAFSRSIYRNSKTVKQTSGIPNKLVHLLVFYCKPFRSFASVLSPKLRRLSIQ